MVTKMFKFVLGRIMDAYIDDMVVKVEKNLITLGICPRFLRSYDNINLGLMRPNALLE